jgi:hypothetical protein
MLTTGAVGHDLVCLPSARNLASTDVTSTIGLLKDNGSLRF